MYAAAGINPPEKGGPRPAPGEPFRLKHTMRTNGEIEVSFIIADRGRGGLLYEVQRRLMSIDGQESPWLPLDVFADKHFIDAHVPAGLRQVQYRARAMRVNGTKGGWSSSLTVPFGTTPAADEAKRAG